MTTPNLFAPAVFNHELGATTSRVARLSRSSLPLAQSLSALACAIVVRVNPVPAGLGRRARHENASDTKTAKPLVEARKVFDSLSNEPLEFRDVVSVRPVPVCGRTEWTPQGLSMVRRAWTTRSQAHSQGRSQLSRRPRPPAQGAHGLKGPAPCAGVRVPSSCETACEQGCEPVADTRRDAPAPSAGAWRTFFPVI